MIGTKIRAARLQAGLRLVDVEIKSGVRMIVISRCERGLTDPHAETVARIAKAINDPDLLSAAREYAEQKRTAVLKKRSLRKCKVSGDHIGFIIDAKIKKKMQMFATEDKTSLSSWLRKLILAEIEIRDGKK